MSQYTDENFKREDWELIQDAIVDQISYLKGRQSWGYEEQVERLEALLEKQESVDQLLNMCPNCKFLVPAGDFNISIAFMLIMVTIVGCGLMYLVIRNK